ncbi:MAG: hypothetical protein AB1486_13690 [Planctomycetota bacterium]
MTASSLQDAEKSRRKNYYIEHSPDDKVCPFSHAELAAEKLAAEGAKVKLVRYEGGHGWQGDVYGRIRAAIEWLEGETGPAKR